MRRAAGLGMMFLLLGGCVTDRLGGPASPIGEWRVVAVNDQPVSGPTFGASFTRSEGTAQFGCNRGSGSVRASRGRIVPGTWAATEMACMPDDRMRHEEAGFRVLSRPMRVTLTMDGVRLANEAGTIDLAP